MKISKRLLGAIGPGPVISLLASSFLISVFSTGGMAAQDQTFYMAIASDPQLDWECVTAECRNLAKTVPDQAILTNRWQSDSINKLASQYGNAFKGVLVNGDLTAYGHDDEFERYFNHFINRIRVPVYPGLGNHDYANNVNDCWNNNCAARMVNYMHNWVLNKGQGIKNYDMKVSSPFYSFPSVRRKFTGSLSYSFDISGVHFVQLHNYPGYQTSFDTWNFPKSMKDTFDIQPSFQWLDKDLAQAAKGGKTIVVNLHDFDDHMSPDDRTLFVNIMKKHKTAAVFWGHWHESQGQSSAAFPIPGFISGSSSNNRYLLAKFTNNKLVQVSVINAIYGNVRVENSYLLSTDKSD